MKPEPESQPAPRYKWHEGDVFCSVCGVPLFGKVKVGSETTSYCYRCAKESLRNSASRIINERFGLPDLPKN